MCSLYGPHPPSISLQTGRVITVDHELWCADEYGKQAASYANALAKLWKDKSGRKSSKLILDKKLRDEELRSALCAFRLIGSRDVRFEWNHDIKPKERLKHFRRKLALKQMRSSMECEIFHPKTGEPAKWEPDLQNEMHLVSLKRLAKSLETNYIRIKAISNGLADTTSKWIRELENAIDPKASPWRCPLVLTRVLCETKEMQELSFTLSIGVYASRLLFYLIADNSTKNLFDPILTADSQSKRSTSHENRRLAPTFTRSLDHKARNALDDIYSVPRLLQRQENTGYASAPQRSLLKLTLKPYQRHTIQWMLDQEADELGINWKFWREHRFLDGGEFYYSSVLGEFRLERPPTVRGGLLTEEMGLGKTLECLALVVYTLYPSDYEEKRRQRLTFIPEGCRVVLKSNSTLIIVPETLVSQWEGEISKSLESGLVTVSTFLVHGKKRTLSGEEKQIEHFCASFKSKFSECDEITEHTFETFASQLGIVLDADEFASMKDWFQNCKFSAEKAALWWRALTLSRSHIVLTTYQTVEKDGCSNMPILERIGWRRIMIDEMQYMRSTTSAMARQTYKLSAQFRWMISGTPIYRDLNDLNGELQFLGVIPFCLDDSKDGFWGRKIMKPFMNKDPDSLTLLYSLLDAIMVRHSKGQRYIADCSRSILDLPPVHEKLVGINLSSLKERAAYAYLESLIYRVTKQLGLKFLQSTGLDLLRQASISLSFVHGGNGLPSLLSKLNQIVRNDEEYLNLRGSETKRPNRIGEREMPSNLLKKYLITNMVSKDRSSNTTKYRYLSSKGQGGGNSSESSRGKHEQNLSQAKNKIQSLQRVIKMGRSTHDGGVLPKLRWQWLISCILCGGYFLVQMIKKKFKYKVNDFPILTMKVRSLLKAYMKLLNANPAFSVEITSCSDNEEICVKNSIPYEYVPHDTQQQNRLRVLLKGVVTEFSKDDVPAREKLLNYIRDTNEAYRKAKTYFQSLCTVNLPCSPPDWLVKKFGDVGCFVCTRMFFIKQASNNDVKALAARYKCFPEKSLGRYAWKVNYEDGSSQIVSPLDLEFLPYLERSKRNFDELRAKMEAFTVQIRKKLNEEASDLDSLDVLDVILEENKADLLRKYSKLAFGVVNGEKRFEKFNNTLFRQLLEEFFREDIQIKRGFHLLFESDVVSVNDISGRIAQLLKPSFDEFLESMPTSPANHSIKHVSQAYLENMIRIQLELKQKDIVSDYVQIIKALRINLPQNGGFKEINLPSKKQVSFQGLEGEIHEGEVVGLDYRTAAFLFKRKSSEKTTRIPLVYLGRMKKRQRLEFVKDLKHRINDINMEISHAREMEKKLKSYISLLETALAIDPEAVNVIELQGLRAIQHLIDEIEPAPSCAICLCPVSSPVCTECIHIFCEECLQKHADAMPLIEKTISSRNFPCPLCRTSINAAEVIRILPSEEGKGTCQKPRTTLPGSKDSKFHPDYSLAVQDCDEILQQAVNEINIVSTAMTPNIEAIDQRFLKVLTSLTGLPPFPKPNTHTNYYSSKICQVLEDLKQVISKGDGATKCVIFSQFKGAILHLDFVLEHENIGRSKIIKGDKQEALRTAIREFNCQERIKVLLLHSSTAAAGLTLTAASHILLLEPFLQEAEEAQAINRVHRIGQSASFVIIHKYYTINTIEERIVCWKRKYKAGTSEKSLSVLSASDKEGIAKNHLEMTSLRYISGFGEV